LGRKLILVDFGSAGKEYLFPNEIVEENPTANTVKGHGLIVCGSE